MTLTPDDVITNAFIESLRLDPKCKFISYDALNAYDKYIEKLLYKQGEIVYSKWWRPSIEQFLSKNKNVFEESTINEKLGITIKDGITVAYLLDTYRSHVPHRLIGCFTNKRAVNTLMKKNKVD